MPDDAQPAVTIRMYRNILGDCFVLTVNDGQTKKVTVIDCGVLQNVADGATMLASLPPAVVASVGRDKLGAVKGGNATIQTAAEDVAAYVTEVNGGTVDLLVVTHEHFDHVSGFALATAVWKEQLTIAKLWLAWTEKPSEDRALVQLRADMAAAKRAIRKTVAAAPHMGAAGQSEEMAAVEALAAFLGPDDDDALAATGGGGIPSTAKTIEMLKQRALAVRYCEPGDVVEPHEAAGLKAYVLGPPHNAQRLRKDSPSGGAAKEVYLANADHAFAVEAAATLAQNRGMAALGGDSRPDPPSAPEVDRSVANQPFARLRQSPYPGQKKTPESPERRAIRKLYEAKANAGLRIEDEWVAAAESLALKLDSDTNNTSLVLAFELPDADRRILLFAADAQVGNWLSWGDQTYPPSFDKDGNDIPLADDAPPRETRDAILGRTVFYKVGHHGSHNATLRDQGLKLMTDTRLVAAIPVVEAIAKVQGKGRKEPGRGWEMPFGEMFGDLKKRTRGRIVMGDGDPATEAAVFAANADQPHSVAISHDPAGLWVELTFPLVPMAAATVADGVRIE